MLWTSVASGSVVGTGAVEVILAGLERGMALIVARFAKLRHFCRRPCTTHLQAYLVLHCAFHQDLRAILASSPRRIYVFRS